MCNVSGYQRHCSLLSSQFQIGANLPEKCPSTYVGGRAPWARWGQGRRIIPKGINLNCTVASWHTVPGYVLEFTFVESCFFTGTLEHVHSGPHSKFQVGGFLALQKFRSVFVKSGWQHQKSSANQQMRRFGVMKIAQARATP
eukprot:1935799-Rhodomonas_salina.5